jgi:hypothetical protein
MTPGQLSGVRIRSDQVTRWDATLGGGLGSVLRWWVGRVVGERYHGNFPLGTFLINVSGSFVIAYLSVLGMLLHPTAQLTIRGRFREGRSGPGRRCTQEVRRRLDQTRTAVRRRHSLALAA